MRKWRLGCSCLWLCIGAASSGCGTAEGRPPPFLRADGGVPGAAQQDAGIAFPKKDPTASTPPHTRSADGGSVAVVEPSADGAPPVADARPSCVPEAGPDEPDDDFLDSNCDGIDGDASAAVFVAPSGSDGAPGTLAAPVQTLKRAVALALATGKSVYLCDADYDEGIHFDGAGVNVYGGYACNRGWERERDRATLHPKDGVPFTMNGVTTPLVVDRVAIRASDADPTKKGTSSVAASIVGSAHVDFRGVLFVAGNAANGVAGKSVADWAYIPDTQPPGADALVLGNASPCSVERGGLTLSAASAPGCASISHGGDALFRPCADGAVVHGGKGGDGGNLGTKAAAGAGASGTPSSNGGDGANGMDGTPGTAAAKGFGEVQDGAYVPSNAGSDGLFGGTGQSGTGGPGGGSVGSNGDPFTTYAPGGGGGQGGYGGCGGKGGLHGSGGGASLGLVVVNSVVRIAESTIQTGRGGDGGNGSDGVQGQKGGAGGKGAYSPELAGADGRHGGDGGHGGAGGPGGGGPSIGVVWTGTEPSLDHVTFATGSPGKGGQSAGLNAANGVGRDTASTEDLK